MLKRVRKCAANCRIWAAGSEVAASPGKTTFVPPTAEAELSASANSSSGGTSSAAHQTGSSTSPTSSPPPSVAALGPQVIPRRHPPADVIARQGSFRGFPALSQKTSPFKRQLSLRMNELPSTMQRKSDFPSRNTGESGPPLACWLSSAPPNALKVVSLCPQSQRWKEKVTASVRCALRSPQLSAALQKTPSPPHPCPNQPRPRSLL